MFQSIMLGGMGSQGITFTAAGGAVWKKGAEKSVEIVGDSLVITYLQSNVDKNFSNL